MRELPQDFINALRVLAITVVIDSRVHKIELTEFEKQAEGLSELFDAGDPIKADYIQWYNDNFAEIKDKLDGRSRNTVILKAITTIEDPAVREALYDAMLAVSISDEDYHRKESDFVRSAAAIWGYMRPPFKVTSEE